jgi:hypothetical protein
VSKAIPKQNGVIVLATVLISALPLIVSGKSPSPLRSQAAGSTPLVGL